MREKMRAAFADRTTGQFDLKHSPGGVADIEFMAQFLLLAHAHDYHSLTTYTDTMRLLQCLAELGLLSQDRAEKLQTIYCDYRNLGHKQALQGNRAVVAHQEVAGQQGDVLAIWQTLMEESPLAIPPST